MKIKFLKLAKEDFKEASDYYTNESQDLSNRFKEDIKTSIDRIIFFPILFPKMTNEVRKCVTSKFPFTIFYRIKNDTIEILAIGNHYQDPTKIFKRF